MCFGLFSNHFNIDRDEFKNKMCNEVFFAKIVIYWHARKTP